MAIKENTVLFFNQPGIFFLSFFFLIFIILLILGKIQVRLTNIIYGISHDRGGHFVPFSVIFAQKLRFEE